MSIKPIVINILSPKNNSFEVKSTHIFNKKVTGGEEDLEIGDIFDIDSVEDVIFPTEIKVKEKEKINMDDILVFPEDTLTDFKLKIYTALGIPIYRQHMFIQIRNSLLNMKYRVTADGAVDTNIYNMFKFEDKLIVPIDMDLYNSREIIRVEAQDSFTTINDIYLNYGVTTYNIVDLNDFMDEHKTTLSEYARADRFQLEILYYGFIVKYFPIMTFDVFAVYAKSESEVKSNFSKMFRSKALINNEKAILSKVYEKKKGFDEFNPEIIESDDKEVSVSIKSALITVDRQRKFVRPTLAGGILSINIRNLFDTLRINKDILAVKAKLEYQGQSFQLLKTGKDFIETPHLKYYNTLLFATKIKNSNVFVIMFDNGKYSIKVNWQETFGIGFKTTFDLIRDKINPIIDRINSMKTAFNSTDRINTITKGNSEFIEISISINWKQPMIKPVFNELMAKFSQYYKAGIFKKLPGKGDFAIIKGVTGYDIRRLEIQAPVDNHYSHFSDPKIRAKWESLYESGRRATIMHRTTDVKIDVINIKEREFKYFYSYIINMFYYFSKETKEFIPKNFIVEVTENKLKRLKEYDPVGYDFKHQGSNIVYSKICQKPHQPIIYSENEYQFLPDSMKKKTVKYWNHTTQMPAYYLCPNKKFPYFSLISGVHPNNLCIGCCKITPQGIGDSKKAKIYRMCIEDHEYIDDKTSNTSSRYIMSYGKDMEFKRIGKPPENLEKFLMYNTKLGEEVKNVLKSYNYYLYGVNQNSPSIPNIGAFYCIISALNITAAKFLLSVSKCISKNNDIFKILLDGDLQKYFRSAEDFVSFLPQIFENSLQHDLDWNRLFIDLLKFCYNINTIIFDDYSKRTSGTSAKLIIKSKIKLVLFEKIKHVEDFIPEEFGTPKKYLILIRRNERGGDDKLYYPMYIIRPRNFFKNKLIEKRIFTNKDNLIIVIRKMISDMLKKVIEVKSNLDLLLISEFVENTKYEVKYKFINNKNMCYAVILTLKGKECYIPIESSFHKKDSTSNYKPFYRKDYELNYKTLTSCISAINEYIIKKSRKMRIIDVEGNVIPIYPLIKVKKFLILNGKTIGFTDSKFYYYFDDFKVIKNPYYLRYDPDDVNKAIIAMDKIEDNRTKLKYISYYYKHIYDLLVFELTNYFDVQRNNIIRKKIKPILNNSKKLSEYINENDINKILGMTSIYSGKKLQKKFDTISFEFDKSELIEMLSSDIKDLVKFLKNIFKKITIKGVIKNEKFPNIFSPCYYSNNAYCKNGKLLIDKSVDLNAFIEIIASEIKNPLTSRFILSSIFNFNLINYHKFIKYKNESLFLIK